MAKCRKCSLNLDESNCSKSFLVHQINICRVCNQSEDKARMIKTRQSVIEKLGNQCECCGNKQFECLSIDHKNGNGIEDRKQFKKWEKYLKHLVKLPVEQLSADYRCLCFNCNCTIGQYGKCPHHFQDYNLESLPTSNRGARNCHLSTEEQKKRNLVLRQINRLKIKLEMIKAYGGRCVDCGEDHPLFLTLDHVNNNGNLEKLRGIDFYQFLKKLGYPGNQQQLQLLCHNCNQAKEYSNRRNNQNVKSIFPENYLKINYSISLLEEEELWESAKKFYAQIIF